MTYNMDWLCAIIDKAYYSTSGLSDHDLSDAFTLLVVAVVAACYFFWIMLSSAGFFDKEYKDSEDSQVATSAVGTMLSTTSRTVILPADKKRTSHCSQKENCISKTVPRAICAKPELDIDELKKILQVDQ